MKRTLLLLLLLFPFLSNISEAIICINKNSNNYNLFNKTDSDDPEVRATYFYGKKPIESSDKKFTAALYSIKIYENRTEVMIEYVANKNIKFLRCYTSKNTFIVVDDKLELPIYGSCDNNGSGEVTSIEYYTHWWLNNYGGWYQNKVGFKKVKKGTKNYVTWVFSGQIPPGKTKISIIDKGDTDGGRGFGWGNISINNPPTNKKIWKEYSVKDNADENKDGICGIYENNNLRLGCINDGDKYKLVYLNGYSKYRGWSIGDTKAILRPTATNGVFKTDWIDSKVSLYNCHNYDVETYDIIIDEKSMILYKDGQNSSTYLKMYPTSTSTNISKSNAQRWTGTGFALNKGYVVTNYHVVEGANSIKVKGVNGDFNTEYKAEVVCTDKINDIAIIKISDSRFSGFGTIPYQIKTSLSEVGENIFVLGYPLTTTMGDEIKLTNGIISSKTGFEGDVSLYQISAPIQPGNSGGPLFDSKGYLIGIVNAKHKGAENVSYAIKTSYLNNLAESSSLTAIFPSKNSISSLTLSEKVKKIKDFVFLIDCQ